MALLLLLLLPVAGFGAVFVGTTKPPASVFTTGFGGVNGEVSGGPYTFAFFFMSSGRNLLISVSRGVGGMILTEGLLWARFSSKACFFGFAVSRVVGSFGVLAVAAVGDVAKDCDVGSFVGIVGLRFGMRSDGWLDVGTVTGFGEAVIGEDVGCFESFFCAASGFSSIGTGMTTGCEGFTAGMLVALTIGGGGGGIKADGVVPGNDLETTNGRGESRFGVVGIGLALFVRGFRGFLSNGFSPAGGEIDEREAGVAEDGPVGRKKIGGTMQPRGEFMFSATFCSTMAFISSSESFGFFDRFVLSSGRCAGSLALRFAEGTRVPPFAATIELPLTALLGVDEGDVDVGDDAFLGGSEAALGDCLPAGSFLDSALDSASSESDLIGASWNEFRNWDCSSSNLGAGGEGASGGSIGRGDVALDFGETLGVTSNLSVDVAISGLR
uniref:Secreted protein n=1 Tax=Anopheles darlingi TaxID=43151 RepID=A0A2M4D4F4_ANODA